MPHSNSSREKKQPADSTDCKWVREVVEAHVMLGSALPAEAEAQLADCPDCLDHLMFLGELQVALLEDSLVVTPPPELEKKLMRSLKTKPRKRFNLWKLGGGGSIWPAVMSTSALLLLLAVGALADPNRQQASGLADPAVVVPLKSGFLVANNDPTGTISLVNIEQNRVQDYIYTQTPRSNPTLRRPLGSMGNPRQMANVIPPSVWYTQGTRIGSKVFLADPLNKRVLEVETEPLKLLRIHAVPEGVVALSSGNNLQGQQVYFKSVRGEVGILNGENIAVSNNAHPELRDYLDGVLLSGGKLWTTHHLRGKVYILDPTTLEIEDTLNLGGAPVALDYTDTGDGSVLVLDMRGRLLRLDRKGKVLQNWALSGFPDQLAVSGNVAVVTDRSGRVTRIDMEKNHVRPKTLAYPTFATRLNDGRFAFVEGNNNLRGVRVLNTDLSVGWRLPRLR